MTIINWGWHWLHPPRSYQLSSLLLRLLLLPTLPPLLGGGHRPERLFGKPRRKGWKSPNESNTKTLQNPSWCRNVLLNFFLENLRFAAEFQELPINFNFSVCQLQVAEVIKTVPSCFAHLTVLLLPHLRGTTAFAVFGIFWPKNDLIHYGLTWKQRRLLKKVLVTW